MELRNLDVNTITTIKITQRPPSLLNYFTINHIQIKIPTFYGQKKFPKRFEEMLTNKRGELHGAQKEKQDNF